MTGGVFIGHANRNGRGAGWWKNSGIGIGLIHHGDWRCLRTSAIGFLLGMYHWSGREVTKLLWRNYLYLCLDQVPCLQNLAVPTLPPNVMRDSLAPIRFQLASATSTNEIAGSANKTAVLSLLVAEIGKGNVERITIMKERNAQSEKMLNIAAVRHAVRTEMDLSKLLLMHKKSWSNVYQELKTLQGTEGYTSDSSETKDAKNYICVLSDRYNNTMRSLENHSA